MGRKANIVVMIVVLGKRVKADGRLAARLVKGVERCVG